MKNIGKETGLLFLSGGSALHDLAQFMAHENLPATHIITVFDDGRSTGKLRQYLEKTGDLREEAIAIGDIRNRLTALSRSQRTNKLSELFNKRFGETKPNELHKSYLKRLSNPDNEIFNPLEKTTATAIARSIELMSKYLGQNFNFQGASLGNLILYGRYIKDRDWLQTIEWAREILDVCGCVLPVTIQSRYLVAILENGQSIISQKDITHEFSLRYSPIKELYLCRSHRSSSLPASAAIFEPSLKAISKSKAIIYSWGSFYTSIISALLVDGVADAILESDAPKILLLNPIRDDETMKLKSINFITEINKYVKKKTGHHSVTHIITLQSSSDKSGLYLYTHDEKESLEKEGVKVLEIESPPIPDTFVFQELLKCLNTISREYT